MAMYRFFQKEEDGPWHPISDSPNVTEDAKRQGAKKLSILAVDKPLDGEDAKRGNKYSGPLYFDIDLADVSHAIESAAKLVDTLINRYQTPEEAIQVFASGKKGLHVLVDQRAFMPRSTAIKDLPLVYKAMAAELYVSGLDLAPYACGRNNTFRIANLKRYDGNYRVPVRISELFKLTGDQYATLVSKPRPDVTHLGYKGPHSIQLNILFSECMEKVVRYDKELTERSRNLAPAQLEKISAEAPPCVMALAEQKGLKADASFNSVALNLALWASRAMAPEIERDRIFAMTADNVESSDRYPTTRSRIQELDGKYRFVMNSPDYKFGCGAMRAMLKVGRKICEGCPLEAGCKGTSTAEFISDQAEKLGIAKIDSGYLRLAARGKTEQISTFTLEAESIYMEEQADGTGYRRRGTFCRVMRHGEELGRVIMPEESWAGKAAFLRALEGVSGVYYTGGDAEIQKIKMLVFIEEENMPEIHQVNAAGIHIESRRGTDIMTYVEPGKSLNNLHMVDTHRLTKSIPMKPLLFKQPDITLADLSLDQTLANLLRSNQGPVIALTVGWTVSCHLKSHLMAAYGQFPLLSVWGQSGSGKSKLVALVSSLTGLDCRANKPANMAATNKFNGVELLSGTTTVPRICEEYNSDKMSESNYLMLGELFKAVWGAEAASRGTVVPGSRGPTSIEIPLTAPVVMLAEQQLKMPALLERTLSVKMVKAGRVREAFRLAENGQKDLMAMGAALMQQAIRCPVSKVKDMVEEEYKNVSSSFEDRPRYSLATVHMGLQWLMKVCSDYHLTDSVQEIRKVKAALLALTAEQEEQVPAKDSQFNLSSILGASYQTEIDQMLVNLGSLATESAATMLAEMQEGRSSGRRIWLNPKSDFKVVGDELYIWGKLCHSRYLEWIRGTGRKTPLMAWNDVKQLVEGEPYFVRWGKFDDFGFNEPVLILSMTKLLERGIDLSSMRSVYEAMGGVEV